MNDVLVAYFSVTGTTKRVAKNLSIELNADLYEIVPVNRYSSNDLNWNDKNSRSSLEGANTRIRPDICSNIEISKYKTIYLGFPIWWYRAPNIINTFLESNNFSNTHIKIFATSGGSGFGNTINYLKSSINGLGTIEEYKVFH